VVISPARTRLIAMAGIGLLAPLAFLVPSLGVAVIPGCGCAGGGAALPGLKVTVADGPGGPAVCGAVVTARDASYTETLIQGTSASGSCLYIGAYGRPGTYTIEVVDGARTVTVENVQVVNGACNVSSTEVTATLPAP
jgi:hypothetical protein